MSTSISVWFRSGRKASDLTPRLIDPTGSTVYGSVLPKQWDKVEAVAQELGVESPMRFCWENPVEAARFMEGLDENVIAGWKTRLNSQKSWHPITDGLTVFGALASYYGEPPADTSQWTILDATAWDIRAIAAVLREALAAGETEFRIREI